MGHELAEVRRDRDIRFANTDSRCGVARAVTYHPASDCRVLPIEALQLCQILIDVSFLAVLTPGYELPALRV